MNRREFILSVGALPLVAAIPALAAPAETTVLHLTDLNMLWYIDLGAGDETVLWVGENCLHKTIAEALESCRGGETIVLHCGVTS